MASVSSIDDDFPPVVMAQIVRNLPRIPQNPEQERRLAALLLRNTLMTHHGRKARLSITEAILLCHLADWDLGVAVEDFENKDKALDRLHIHFDRMRSSEGTKPSRDIDINGAQERQSERLAILMSITTRTDWGSLQNFLAKEQFDLISALERWYKYGITVATTKADKKKTSKDVFSNEIPLPFPADCVADPQLNDGAWADEFGFYQQVADYDGDQNLIPLPPLREDDRHRVFGTLLFPDRTTLQRGNFHVEDYFVVEAINKNKYVHARFSKNEFKKKSGGALFKWPKLGAGYGEDITPSDDEDDTDEEEKTKKKRKTYVTFSFNDPQHLALLNNWRRQIFSRTTGVLMRAGSQQWQPVELAKLYQLVDDYWTEYVLDKGLEDDDYLPVSRKKLEFWAEELDECFIGTCPGSTAIRGDRTWEAVGTQLRRTFPIIDSFNIPEDKAWFVKKEKVVPKIRDQQRIIVAEGKTQLLTWDPEAERNKKEQKNTPEQQAKTGKKVRKILPVVNDTLTDDNDSDATKERKAHSKRSRQKLKMESDARKKERADTRQAVLDSGGSDDTSGDKDVLVAWNLRLVEGGADDGDGSDNDADDESESDGEDGSSGKVGEPQKKKRKAAPKKARRGASSSVSRQGDGNAADASSSGSIKDASADASSSGFTKDNSTAASAASAPVPTDGAMEFEEDWQTANEDDDEQEQEAEIISDDGDEEWTDEEED